VCLLGVLLLTGVILLLGSKANRKKINRATVNLGQPQTEKPEWTFPTTTVRIVVSDAEHRHLKNSANQREIFAGGPERRYILILEHAKSESFLFLWDGKEKRRRLIDHVSFVLDSGSTVGHDAKQQELCGCPSNMLTILRHVREFHIRILVRPLTESEIEHRDKERL
jgi:hypothetical protein